MGLAEDLGIPRRTLIWWTSDEDCRQIAEPPDWWPEYIREEFLSRRGRNARGRLWYAPGISVVGFQWNDDGLMARAAAKCGGIVIWAKDASCVAPWPGFITDLALNVPTTLRS